MADVAGRNLKDAWRLVTPGLQFALAACDPRRPDPMNFFTYGSLMFPEVWCRVTGRDHPSAPAVLADHAARRVRGETYPGLIAAPGERTDGIVYFDVEPEAAQRLDTFEGPFYTRTTVAVRRQDGEVVAAEVYLVNEDFRGSLLAERWDAGEFRARHLDSFIGPARAG